MVLDSMTMIFAWTFLSVSLVCFFGQPIAKALGILDIPGGRKLHSGAVPLVGGLAFCVGVLPVFPILFPNETIGIAFTLGILTMLVLGMLDDRFDIRPLYRLIVACLVFGLCISSSETLELRHIYMTTMAHPHFLGLAGIYLTIIMAVGFLNALNMADGKNGIVLVSSLIWCSAMYMVAPDDLLPLLRVTAIALAIILVFNLKEKLFLGDGGAYALSSFWALMAIYIHSIDSSRLPADLAALWFAIPVLDAARLIFGRIIEGKSAFVGDRDHLHHLIYDVFHNRTLCLTIYSSLVGIPTALAYFAPNYIAGILASVIAFYIMFLTYLKAQVAKQAT